MNERIFDMYKERIGDFTRKCEGCFYGEFVPLKAEFALTDDAVPYCDRLKLKYQPLKEGDVWGREWQSAWVHVTGSVPKTWRGKEVCLRFNAGGEALVFDADGVPAYGLTGASIYNLTYQKECYVLKGAKPGSKVDLWIEIAASTLSGIDLPRAWEIAPAAPHGRLQPVVKQLKLCIFDREMWHFAVELTALYEWLCYFKTVQERGNDAVPTEDYRAKQLLEGVTRAFDVYNYHRENVKAARKVLQELVFSHHAEEGAPIANTIGHAHIDVGWLWPVKESTRKAARTFSSQLALMEQYPDYKFGASQAYLYKVVKEHYPELYQKIKKRIAEKRWEVQGGMWVEADSNLISGESMVRQFLYGKNFFMDEFGVDVKTHWIPDVFGYSAATPQIAVKSGCPYFLTQKLSSNKINTFPHHTFRWVGVDGTELLTHFPPERTYNANPDASRRMKAMNIFAEAGTVPGFMSLMGIGDGGGGPAESYIERNKMMGNLRGLPPAPFRFALDYFEELEAYRSKLAKWQGELYYELHRGTFTTQAHTKRGNRLGEQALTALEVLTTALPAKKFPKKMLHEAWETLLLNQFHDIIPGSSIALVYERTEKEHAEILKAAAKEAQKAAKALFKADKACAVYVNTLAVPWQGAVALPAGWEGATGVPCQQENGNVFALVTIPAFGTLTLKRGKAAAKTVHTKSLTLENDLVKYVFNAQGRLISAYDKSSKREFLTGEGNALNFYVDIPVTNEAWDIDIHYPHDRQLVLDGTAVGGLEKGAVRRSLEFVYHTPGGSEVRQKAVLANGSRRLDFVTRVHWEESRKMLRVVFPTVIQSKFASFDIQYATFERPTHDNTTWDEAQFEVCGQRYADLSGRNCGAALLNDCKYGYKVKGSSLEMTLLRSPKFPDYFADKGDHEFVYSFLPHEGALSESCVRQEAAILNRAPYCFDGYAAEGLPLPVGVVETDGVSLEVVKRAEKSDAVVIRLVETKGAESRITLNVKAKALIETDLLEWKKLGVFKVDKKGRVELLFKPFEIRTFILA